MISTRKRFAVRDCEKGRESGYRAKDGKVREPEHAETGWHRLRVNVIALEHRVLSEVSEA